MDTEISNESTQEVGNTPEITPEAPVSTPESAPSDDSSPSDTVAQKVEKLAKKGGKSGKSSEKEATTPEVPAYSPNFKYKVGDKEHEFDEWIRPAVKTKEQEEKLRDYYTKAFGIDAVKEDREKIKGEASTYSKKYSELETAVQNTLKPLKTGDLGSFFKALNIPQEAVYKYVHDQLNYQDLPPDQKVQIDQQREIQQRAQQYEERYNQQTQRSQELEVRLLTNELEFELSKPEIKEMSQVYQERTGKSFRDEIIRQGDLMARTYGKVYAPREVISELAATVGKLMGPLGQQAPAQQQVPGPAKPTLPNIQGRATTPVKAKVQTLDDLKKLAASFGR